MHSDLLSSKLFFEVQVFKQYFSAFGVYFKLNEVNRRMLSTKLIEMALLCLTEQSF